MCKKCRANNVTGKVRKDGKLIFRCRECGHTWVQ